MPLRAAADAALASLAARLPGATLMVTLHDHADDRLSVLAARDVAGFGIDAGAVMPLGDAFCTYMAADLAPRRSDDVAADLVLGAANGVGAASYVGVPLELPDGRRVGSVCALSRENAAFDAGDEEELDSVAARLVEHLAPDAAPARPRALHRLRAPLPFLAALLLAFASVPLPPEHPTVVWAVVAAALLAAGVALGIAFVRWERMPPIVRMTPAYAVLAVVALLREGEGGSVSGLAVLVLLPVLWVALHGDRRELLLAVALSGLTVLLPPLLAGAPGYPPFEYRRGVVSTAVALLLGLAVQRVVALAHERTAQLSARAEDLAASEEHKRLILATAGDGILGVDAELRVTFANPAAAALTGHAPAALAGRALGDLLVEADAESRGGVMRRADGSTFPVEHVIRPQRRAGAVIGAVVTFADVTRRRAAEQALADEREFLAAVLANLREGVVACGPDGRLRLFNDAARRLHHLPAAALAPEDSSWRSSAYCADAVTPLPHDEVPLFRAFAGHTVRDDELVIRPRGGEARTVLANGQSIRDADGGLLGAVATLSDITDRRHAERMKEEFFALVSHELRTPLTSIVGYLEVLVEEDAEDGNLPPHQRRFLGTIERNARRLQRLVGDLLFVAQLEAGRLALEPGEADLAALAAEAVEAGRPRAAERGVELTLDAAPVPVCPGDTERLGQVLDNLVSNALKFTPAGGTVAVRVGAGAHDVWAEVADTGIGIPEEELALLFERFFRASSATRAQIPGIGLGLAITRAIVEGHDGTVAVTSTEGVGTTFRIRLPARAPSALAA